MGFYVAVDGHARVFLPDGAVGGLERTPMATWLRLTKLIVIGEEKRGAGDVRAWGLERSIIVGASRGDFARRCSG